MHTINNSASSDASRKCSVELSLLCLKLPAETVSTLSKYFSASAISCCIVTTRGWVFLVSSYGEYESSRFENLECCSDGDVVLYETSYETDNYIVTNEYGSELGELGAKAVEWIEENEGDIKIVKINNIGETDSGSLKADIEFYYR